MGGDRPSQTMNCTITPILVRELVLPGHTPPPESDFAFFQAAVGTQIHFAQVVCLRLVGKLVVGANPLEPTFYPLYNIGIEGPVVGERMVEGGMEYVVRNERGESEIKLVVLRVAFVRGVPFNSGLARALSEKLSRAIRGRGMMWHFGIRAAVPIQNELRPEGPLRRPRLPKTARAPTNGLGPASANGRAKKRTHVPQIPSPLKNETSPMMEE